MLQDYTFTFNVDFNCKIISSCWPLSTTDLSSSWTFVAEEAFQRTLAKTWGNSSTKKFPFLAQCLQRVPSLDLLLIPLTGTTSPASFKHSLSFLTIFLQEKRHCWYKTAPFSFWSREHEMFYSSSCCLFFAN